MGCFPCFESRDREPLSRDNASDRRREELPMVAPHVERSPMGDDKMRIRSNLHTEKESLDAKKEPLFANSAQTFTLRELANATGNFRSECFLGEGGFGRVYRGRLESTGQVVAVKQLDRNGLQGNREFLVEVLMLNLLHHSNLVNLIGYCADGDQRLLVYEYMPLGSLEDHLHDLPPEKEPLDWITRMKIAAGAAKGLEYLHDQASPPVIYRDLKTSNILLDKGFHPKLSDFGLAKLGPVGDKSHVSTRVMGTYGYCAPEYALTGQLTVKSDVYSFGVVLLELITGRKAIDGTKPHAEQNLVSWVRPIFKDRKRLPSLADPKLRGRFPMRGLYQALAVASMCIQEDAAARPIIADVVTAISYLASQAYDPSTVPTDNKRPGGERRGRNAHEEGETILTIIDNGEPGQMQQMNYEDLPKEATTMLRQNVDRERALAEAKQWGANWREKMQTYYPDAAPTSSNRPGVERGRNPNEGGRMLTNNNDREPMQMQYHNSDNPNDTAAALRRNFDREQALAEAKMWGQNWREKTQAKANAQGGFDVANAIG